MLTTKLPDGINIRLSTPADIDAYRALRLEALKSHPSAFGQDYDENLLRPREYWEKVLTRSSDEQALFFAEQKGQLTGMTGIYRSLSKKSLHSATIWGVYVKPEWRGHHIAEALIRSCLDWAKKHGVTIVKLAVETGNLQAVSCYERCGFVTYGTEPKAIHHDDNYYDEYLMAIEVGSMNFI